MFRADPGLGDEMKRAIEEERDLYTLFSVALDQNTPMDIRRLAANRLNVFDKEALSFIRNEATATMLEGIMNGRLFPSTFKSFAKATREGMTGEEMLLAALMEQNRLLKQLKRRAGESGERA